MADKQVLSKIASGISGAKRKKQLLFSFGAKNGEEWSEDSSDSDYAPCSKEKEAPTRVISSCPSQLHSQQRKRSKHEESAVTLPCRAPATGVSAATAGKEKCLYNWGTDVPQEVLLKIFSSALPDKRLPFLCSICRVCKLWNRVGSDARLWAKLDLSYGWIKARQRLLPCLWEMGRLAHLCDLSLARWDTVDVRFLTELHRMCPTLERLCLANCYNVREEGLHYVLKGFHSLRALDISCSPAEKPVTDGRGRVRSHVIVVHRDTFAAAALLTNLIIAGNSCDFSAIEAITDNCPLLEVLDISNMTLRGTAPHILSLIIRMQQRLKCLRVLRMTRTLSSARLRCPSLVEESAGFPQLVEFSCAADVSISQAPVASLYHYSGDILHYIVGKSPRLQLLDVQGWSASVLAIFARLPAAALKYLYIANLVAYKFPPHADVCLSQWSKTLVDLDLSWASVAPIVLERLFEQVFVAGSHLEEINISGLPIGDAHVRNIVTNCQRLRFIDLSSCRNLTRGLKRRHETAEAVAKLLLALSTSV